MRAEVEDGGGVWVRESAAQRSPLLRGLGNTRTRGTVANSPDAGVLVFVAPKVHEKHIAVGLVDFVYRRR